MSISPRSGLPAAVSSILGAPQKTADQLRDELPRKVMSLPELRRRMFQMMMRSVKACLGRWDCFALHSAEQIVEESLLIALLHTG